MAKAQKLSRPAWAAKPKAAVNLAAYAWLYTGATLALFWMLYVAAAFIGKGNPAAFSDALFVQKFLPSLTLVGIICAWLSARAKTNRGRIVSVLFAALPWMFALGAGLTLL